MKTLKDLFDLILSETEMSIDKASIYTFDLNTQYGWLSMYNEVFDGDETKERTIFQNMSIKTEAELQMAYWTVYNNGRSKNR